MNYFQKTISKFVWYMRENFFTKCTKILYDIRKKISLKNHTLSYNFKVSICFKYAKTNFCTKWTNLPKSCRMSKILCLKNPDTIPKNQYPNSCGI